MKKEEFELLALDYLRDTLLESEREAFEELLDNDNFKGQFEEFREVWKMMDGIRVPEPSQAMDSAFFSTLADERDKQRKKKFPLKDYLNDFLSLLMKPQLAYSLLFLVLVGGYVWNTRLDPSSYGNRTVVDSETEQVREKLVLTLLEQNSANKRLEGVAEANKINKVDDQVINALLRTLNMDPNVNVRLAAIESLTNYVENPKVRQGLIQSIPNQESPIIQVTLANLMLALEEKKSIEPFKKLLEKPELDTTVKKKIEKTIKSII
ncbi:MAG: hypothetical protein AAGH81_10875 [Bacteroidota bacterium]